MNKLIIALGAVLLLGAKASPTTPDRPETGKQGETLAGEAIVLPKPYSKGVNVVGHNPLDGRKGNLIMAWSRHCAYVADGISMAADGSLANTPFGPTSGVADIDATNPRAPKVIRYLHDKGARAATETMHAVTIPGRAVLAASVYAGVSGMGPAKEGWLDIYDISKCANPELMAEVKWPEAVHTLTVSPNGKRVYGTVINPFTGDGGIQVIDISDMAHPRFIGKFAATRPDGSSFPFAAHEVTISPDEKRIYAGVIASKGGDLNKGIKLMPPNAEGLGPDAGGIYVLDNSDLAEGKPDPKMRLIGTSLHGGWHSPVRAQFNGVPMLVSAGELGACPGAWPRITTLADETSPRVIGELRLAMNKPENCPERTAMEKATGGVVGRAGIAASHFNDVDSPTNTRLGLFTMMYAGLRIADLRDPTNPKEIAYFKPGDACMSHVRYVRETGQIWFACNDSGFYVIEVKPELRKTLRLELGRDGHVTKH